ncbi:hypothetical protein [Microcystis phage Mvi-JY20]|uniref:SGNH hydrolase-type esterase domain-containing protein n=1 Tax=Microcystis phage Mvi-JY20 TaxID=3128146 RepID=A0AAX4QG99_9CAUD
MLITHQTATPSGVAFSPEIMRLRYAGRNNQAPLRVSWLGDSITAGTNGGFPFGQGAAPQLFMANNALLNWTTPDDPTYREVNSMYGIGGLTLNGYMTYNTAPLNHQIYLRQHSPDVLFVWLGHNDLAGQSWTTSLENQMRRNWQALCGACLSVGVVPVLVELIRTTSITSNVIENANRVARQVAQQFGIPFLEGAYATIEADNAAKTRDGIHPNAIGCRDISAAWTQQWRSWQVGRDVRSMLPRRTGTAALEDYIYNRTNTSDYGPYVNNTATWTRTAGVHPEDQYATMIITKTGGDSMTALWDNAPFTGGPAIAVGDWAVALFELRGTGNVSGGSALTVQAWNDPGHGGFSVALFAGSADIGVDGNFGVIARAWRMPATSNDIDMRVIYRAAAETGNSTGVLEVGRTAILNLSRRRGGWNNAGSVW